MSSGEEVKFADIACIIEDDLPGAHWLEIGVVFENIQRLGSSRVINQFQSSYSPARNSMVMAACSVTANCFTPRLLRTCRHFYL